MYAERDRLLRLKQMEAVKKILPKQIQDRKGNIKGKKPCRSRRNKKKVRTRIMKRMKKIPSP